MKTFRLVLLSMLSIMVFGCGSRSSDKIQDDARKIKAFQLEILKKTEADPVGNTTRFNIDGRSVSVYRGMTVEQVIERCGRPSDDVNVDMSNVKVLTYKSNSIQLFFTYGILTDYVVLDF